MSKYTGPPTKCHDCLNEPATETLGRRRPPVRTGEKRQFLYVCSDCADARIGRGKYSPEAIKESNKKAEAATKMIEEVFKSPEGPAKGLTRSDSFAQGHQKTTEPEYYQPSLFDE